MDRLASANRLLVNLIAFFLGVYLVFCLLGCAPEAPRAQEEELSGRVIVTADRIVNGEGIINLTLTNIEGHAYEAAAVAVKLAKATGRTLVVTLDGHGGLMLMGQDIVLLFVTADLPDVRCVVHTRAYSMNAYLFEMLPCQRAMGKKAVIVFHHVSVPQESEDTESDVLRKLGHEEEFTEGLCESLAHRTAGKVQKTYCHERLHDNDKRDWTLNYAQASALNLTDYSLEGTK